MRIVNILTYAALTALCIGIFVAKPATAATINCIALPCLLIIAVMTPPGQQYDGRRKPKGCNHPN
jgi:hypothetical protein